MSKNDEEKTRQTRRGEAKGEYSTDTNSDRQAGSAGNVNEHQQVGGNREIRSPLRVQSQRENYIGGIFRQLRDLQQAHLAYVNAHTDRLRARLADDEAHRQELTERMAQLERDLIQELGEKHEELEEEVDQPEAEE